MKENKAEKFYFFFESVEGVFLSTIRYVLLLLFFFGLLVAFASLFSDSFDIITTSQTFLAVNSVVVIALLIIWRELRDIRIWLDGISQKYEKVYSKIVRVRK